VFLWNLEEKLSMGSSRLPAASFFHRTSGRETSTSWPSRRICSDQDGDLHFATDRCGENLRVIGLLDPQGDVRPGSLTSRSQMWRAVTSCVVASRGPSVDGEFHLDRWRVDWLVRQGGAFGIIDEALPMKTSSKPVTPTMSPACRFLNLDAL